MNGGRYARLRQALYPSTRWGEADHAAMHRPPCSECDAQAAVWQRCKCRVYFARCKDHQPNTAVSEMRTAHTCKETAP